MDGSAEIADATRIIEFTLRQKMPGTFHESLVSGVRLCMFYISLFPLRRRPKYRSGRPEHYEGNILSFLDTAATVVPSQQLFLPSDLLSGHRDGLIKVAKTIQALAKASGRTFPVHLPSSVMAPPPTARTLTAVKQPQASDAMSVESSGSSTTDWCRVDLTMSSPQQQNFSPLSPHDSWVRVPRFEGLGSE